MWILLALFITDSGNYNIKHNHVDLIEINTYLNNNGEVILKQLIFWKLTTDGCVVIDWRSCEKIKQLPYKHGPGYRLYWIEGNSKVVVDSWDVIDTVTDFDPEAVNRDKFDMRYRKYLSR